MATVDSLNIQITSDSKKAEQGIESLIKKLDVLSAKLRGTNLASSNAFKNLTKGSKNLKESFEAVSKSITKVSSGSNKNINSVNKYAASFAALYARIRLVIRGFEYLQQSVKNTSDYIETYNFYNVSFGKIASEWDKDWEKYGYNNAEAYADSFTKRLNADFEKMSGVKVEMFEDGSGILASTGLKNLGLNIQEITQYGAQLASVTNAVGQTGETSLAVARTFSKLAGDVSSLFNVDYSSVASNIQSVLQGQSRAGYKYGWDTTLATLQQYADALDLSKPVSEMSQMEKQQLRILAVLDQSKVAWGDLANTINSPSNMMRQFKNNVAEVGLVLGQLFIPILQKVMPVLNGATIALKNFLTSFGSMLGIQLDLDSFGQGFSKIEDNAEDLSEGLDEVTSSANKALKALGKYDELNNISSSSNSLYSSDSLKDSIDLTDEIIKAAAEYEAVWSEAYNNMQNKAEEIARKIKKFFEPLANVFVEDFNNIEWEDISKNLKDFEDAIAPFAEEFGQGLIDFFEDVGDFSVGVINDLFGEDGAIKNLTDWLNDTDPEKARKWGYALGALGLGIGSLMSLQKIMSLLTPASIGFGKLAKSVALFVPLITFFETQSTEGANKYLESIEKFNSFDFENMGLKDWTDILQEFGMATAGLSGEFYARQTQVADYFNSMPLRENYATLEEYNAALEEWQENQLNYFGEQKNVLDVLGEKMSTWAEEKLAPWLSKKVWEEYTKDATSGIEEEWGETETWWLKSINKIGEAMSGLTGPAFGMMGKGSYSVPQYATGGFPEDGLFMANRGELVGQFSNGRTAVANNEQITKGIADAVYPAVYNAVVSAMSNNNGNGNVTVEIDGREVFRTVQDYANRYTDRTRRPAFG